MTKNHMIIYYTNIDAAPDFNLSKLSFDGSVSDILLSKKTSALSKANPSMQPSPFSSSTNTPSHSFLTKQPTINEQAKRKHLEQKQLQQKASKWLKQKVLGKKYSTITLGEHGKPILPSSSLHFNVSHSGNLIGIALCEKEIGLDIQALRTYSELLVKKAFTKTEQKWLSHQEPASSREIIEKNGTQKPLNKKDTESIANKRFLLLWTAKESYLKAIGKGFSIPPASFDILPKGEELEKLNRWLKTNATNDISNKNSPIVDSIDNNPEAVPAFSKNETAYSEHLHSINPTVFSWQKTIADGQYQFSLTFQEGCAFCVCTKG